MSGKFVPPIMRADDSSSKQPLTDGGQGQGQTMVDERLKNIEPRMIEIITSEVCCHGIGRFKLALRFNWTIQYVALTLCLDYGSWPSGDLGRYWWT